VQQGEEIKNGRISNVIGWQQEIGENAVKVRLIINPLNTLFCDNNMYVLSFSASEVIIEYDLRVFG
jgi:hypothetical protein